MSLCVSILRMLHKAFIPSTFLVLISGPVNFALFRCDMVIDIFYKKSCSKGILLLASGENLSRPNSKNYHFVNQEVQ